MKFWACPILSIVYYSLLELCTHNFNHVILKKNKIQRWVRIHSCYHWSKYDKHKFSLWLHIVYWSSSHAYISLYTIEPTLELRPLFSRIVNVDIWSTLTTHTTFLRAKKRPSGFSDKHWTTVCAGHKRNNNCKIRIE